MILTIDDAIKIVKEGGIVIYPTDTAFGIGCRIDRADSVKRLFSLRHRPTHKPTPVLCSSIEMVKEYVEKVPESVHQCMKTYWPGALTIILKSQVERIPALVRGGGKTVGMRIPDHDIPLRLIEGVGVPIIGTSANFAGQMTPYSVSELDPLLIEKVEGVIGGECTLKKESTVIDATVTPWKILRQGAVTLSGGK